MFFLKKKKKLLFIFGCAVSLVLATRGLSLVAVSVGYSLGAVLQILTAGASPGGKLSAAQAQKLWLLGSGALAQ